jgi:capsular exopolysaccharide synthesis family protein
LIITFVVVSLGVGYGVYRWLRIHHPRYVATGIVQVNPPLSTDPLKADLGLNISELVFEQKNNAELLKADHLYSMVLQNQTNGIHDTDWYNSFNNDTSLAKQDLMENLMVMAVPETLQIRVQFSARNPADAEKIVNAVVEERMAEQKSANDKNQEIRLATLNNAKQAYEQQRADLSAELQDLIVRLNISQNGSAALSQVDSQLFDLSHDRLLAQQAVDVATGKLEHLKAEIAAGQDPSSVVLAMDRDPQVLKYSDLLTNLDASILQQTDLGVNNKVLTQLSTERDLYQKKLQDVQESVKQSSTNELLDSARDDVQAAQMVLDGVNKNIAVLDTKNQSLSRDMRDYTTYHNQLLAVEENEKAVQNELDQINQYSNQKDQTNLEWASQAEASDIPIFPKLSVTMTMAIALGLALSLGIAFFRDMMDTTVRSPRDIARVGNMTVLGMIPHEDDDPQARGTRLPLVIFEAPQSMMAEQLRQVRTRLQHAASLDTTRTILITSPSPDDGKSMIAANLASGLALNGRRILLVDANFRRPSVHRMFNLANDVGFSDVLNKLDAFESAVQQTQVPNLYVLPSGLKPTNATELLESQLLTDFIERVLEEFDHVIFDSGPLLFVSETVALAPRVDGVVTVVRARTNSRGLLQRLRDSLKQIKAEHLGVVLNAVRSHGGGYYRSNIRTYYDYQNDRAA